MFFKHLNEFLVDDISSNVDDMGHENALKHEAYDSDYGSVGGRDNVIKQEGDVGFKSTLSIHLNVVEGTLLDSNNSQTNKRKVRVVGRKTIFNFKPVISAPSSSSSAPSSLITTSTSASLLSPSSTFSVTLLQSSPSTSSLQSLPSVMLRSTSFSPSLNAMLSLSLPNITPLANSEMNSLLLQPSTTSIWPSSFSSLSSLSTSSSSNVSTIRSIEFPRDAVTESTDQYNFTFNSNNFSTSTRNVPSFVEFILPFERHLLSNNQTTARSLENVTFNSSNCAHNCAINAPNEPILLNELNTNHMTRSSTVGNILPPTQCNVTLQDLSCIPCDKAINRFELTDVHVNNDAANDDVVNDDVSDVNIIDDLISRTIELSSNNDPTEEILDTNLAEPVEIVNPPMKKSLKRLNGQSDLQQIREKQNSKSKFKQFVASTRDKLKKLTSLPLPRPSFKLNQKFKRLDNTGVQRTFVRQKLATGITTTAFPTENKKNLLNLALHTSNNDLNIEIYNGHQLQLTDNMMLDSYAEIALHSGANILSWRTSIIENTINPTFNESFSLELRPEDVNGKLVLTMYQQSEDRGNKIFIGRMAFKLSTCLQQKISGYYYLLPAETGLNKHLKLSECKDYCYKQIILRSQLQSNKLYGMRLSGNKPCTITYVSKCGLAREAGLMVGDEILQIDDMDAQHDNAGRIVVFIRNSRKDMILRVKRRNSSDPLNADINNNNHINNNNIYNINNNNINNIIKPSNNNDNNNVININLNNNINNVNGINNDINNNINAHNFNIANVNSSHANNNVNGNIPNKISNTNINNINVIHNTRTGNQQNVINLRNNQFNILNNMNNHSNNHFNNNNHRNINHCNHKNNNNKKLNNNSSNNSSVECL